MRCTHQNRLLPKRVASGSVKLGSECLKPAKHVGKSVKADAYPSLFYFILFYFLDILFDVALILHLHTMLCLIKPALRNFFNHTVF